MRHPGAIIHAAIFFLITIVLNSNTSWSATTGAAVSPLSVDPKFKPRSGIYYYTVGFNEMNIGTASIGIDNENEQYKIQVQARTIGMVDRIYHLRYKGESVMDKDPVSPMKLQVQQDLRSKEKITSIHFQANGAIRTIETKSENGDSVDYTVRTVQTDKFTVDPFSASYLLRGIDWEIGVEKVFDVYPGKHQYELRLKCTGKESLVIAGEKREAWVIIPRVTNLDPEKRAEGAKKKPADIKIYVSADGLRDVLKVEAHHSLGQFLARLDRFEPAAQTRDETLKKITIREEEHN